MEKNLEQINKEILVHYNKAYNVAFEWLKNHLTQMLKDNKRRIGCIINAMGAIAFYDKKTGEPLLDHQSQELKGHKELEDFMDEWDDVFKLTGDPIRINSDLEIVTDW